MNEYNNYSNNQHTDTVKKSTFFITVISLIVVFIISLVCVILYYENKRNSIPLPIGDDGSNDIVQNISIVE